MIIAIDGPAASGKGTLARALARHYALAYLDTGLLYRAVGMKAIRAGGDPSDAAFAARMAASLRDEDLLDPAIRGEAAAAAASKAAATPEVRAALLDYQRRFAASPPGGAKGAVLDGRDIGTVICPGADVKIYVTATLEARARRRHRELLAGNPGLRLEDVVADLERRDARDRERATAPARPALDAHLLDTTNLDIDSVIERAKELISGSKS